MDTFNIDTVSMHVV